MLYKPTRFREATYWWYNGHANTWQHSIKKTGLLFDVCFDLCFDVSFDLCFDVSFNLCFDVSFDVCVDVSL
jgi:hypothetical protein